MWPPAGPETGSVASANAPACAGGRRRSRFRRPFTISRVLYGRDPERARLKALLEAARLSRSGVLVLRGEPGIGKTALLEDTRERAADMQVLAARGVESESELP